MKKLSSNKGFTLVELIIVIAILAIIAAIVVGNYSGIQQRMQVRADKASAAQIGKAVRIWYTEYTSDEAFKKAVGTETPAYTATEDAASGVVTKTYTTKGKIPSQDKDDAVAMIPIGCVAKLDEYVDVNVAPSSLREGDASGKSTGVVDAVQLYYVGVVGAGAAEKVVVSISNATAPKLPAVDADNPIDSEDVLYTGDPLPTGDDVKFFQSSLAYIEP